MARSRFLSTPCRTLCGSCDSSGCLTVHSLGCWTLVFVRQHAVWINPHLMKGASDSNSRASPWVVAGTGCPSHRQVPGPRGAPRSREPPCPGRPPPPSSLRSPGLPEFLDNVIQLTPMVPSEVRTTELAAPRHPQDQAQAAATHCAPAGLSDGARLNADLLPAPSPKSSGRCRDGRRCNRRCATPDRG